MLESGYITSGWRRAGHLFKKLILIVGSITDAPYHCPTVSTFSNQPFTTQSSPGWSWVLPLNTPFASSSGALSPMANWILSPGETDRPLWSPPWLLQHKPPPGPSWLPLVMCPQQRNVPSLLLSLPTGLQTPAGLSGHGPGAVGPSTSRGPCEKAMGWLLSRTFHSEAMGPEDWALYFPLETQQLCPL